MEAGLTPDEAAIVAESDLKHTGQLRTVRRGKGEVGCSSDFGATNRIVGRAAASAIASASAASFFCRFTKGFT